MYVTRDKFGRIELWERKPRNDGGKLWFNGIYITTLNSKLFPELTFENSPMEVELKLKEK